MLLQFDGTLIAMALSFIIFMIVMQKIFYAPMTEVRNERSNYINTNVNLAKGADEKAVSLVKDYDNKITQARIKANNVVFESTTAASKEKAGILETINAEAGNQLNQAKADILKDKNSALEALKPQILSLAHSISTKVLGEEVPVSGITQEMVDKSLNG